VIAHRQPFIIHQFDKLSSTNDVLRKMTNEPEFTCVVAGEQTAGRGRRDRQWHSSPGDGLYLSVLLLPETTKKLSLLSLVFAISVAETLIERNVPGVDIKWPNDVLVNDRKLCGILIESISTGTNCQPIIAGIGVNLNHQSFPDELSETATSLKIETGRSINGNEFRDQLLQKLFIWYELWKLGEEKRILDRWQQLSSFALGQPVKATLDAEIITGETAGLTEDGALKLRLEDGSLRTVLAGEVTRLRKDTT
jgi:BirA family biotin operon repressor/biotin-[acetyl-CoA-carboxylase] ligase